jgi:uncharacterized protein YndB with AHSA1/START domain
MTMSSFRITNTYAHSIDVVWAALTDPALIPKWTATGQGARPEGFEPTVGTRFRYIGKPVLGWDGVVHCEVLDVDAPRHLRYTWANHPDDKPTVVTYDLSAAPSEETIFVYEHTGFTGLGGLAMSQLLARVRRKMLAKGLPPVLDELADSTTSPPPTMHEGEHE